MSRTIALVAFTLIAFATLSLLGATQAATANDGTPWSSAATLQPLDSDTPWG